MIRLVTVEGQQELLVPSELSLELQNPSFGGTDVIPGVASLPLGLPWARENLRALNFPDRYRGPGGPPPVAVDCYLDQVRWRRGKLVFLSLDEPGQLLQVQFVADAADLAAQLKDVKLDALDLGTAPLDRTGQSTDYALLPVRNATFFGDAAKAPAGYAGYLNYVPAGSGAVPAGAPVAPQPYLLPILRKVLASVGYALTGAWAQLPEVAQLVLYSDRLCVDASTVTLNRHVPSVNVVDLLLDVAGYFCLQSWFNPLTREARFTPLRDVVTQAAASQRPRAGRRQTTTANTTTGFTLSLEPDANDELDKTLDTSWQKLVVGQGGEAQAFKMGTLHQVTVAEGSRTWLVPAYEGKGAVPGNADVGDESRVGLRLLVHRGWQPDSAGNLYPLGSAGTTNQHGAVVGSLDLRLSGEQGLGAQWHQAWLAFRARAVQHTYECPLTVADLLTLDPSQADMVDYHLCLWEKLSLTVTANAPLSTATFTYQELL